VVVQKIIEIVGVSKKDWADAAKDAVKVAGKTVRNMKWARMGELECSIEGDKITEYRATLRIYFDVER
jgi:flavin-binding protein dodecin